MTPEELLRAWVQSFNDGDFAAGTALATPDGSYGITAPSAGTSPAQGEQDARMWKAAFPDARGDREPDRERGRGGVRGDVDGDADGGPAERAGDAQAGDGAGGGLRDGEGGEDHAADAPFRLRGAAGATRGDAGGIGGTSGDAHRRISLPKMMMTTPAPQRPGF
jgi:hypothetical protein